MPTTSVAPPPAPSAVPKKVCPSFSNPADQGESESSNESESESSADGCGWESAEESRGHKRGEVSGGVARWGFGYRASWRRDETPPNVCGCYPPESCSYCIWKLI
jgi:hypothetical protein